MHLEIWVYSIHYTDRGQIQHQLKRYGQNSAFSNSRGGVFTIENDHPYPHKMDVLNMNFIQKIIYRTRANSTPTATIKGFRDFGAGTKRERVLFERG